MSIFSSVSFPGWVGVMLAILSGVVGFFVAVRRARKRKPASLTNLILLIGSFYFLAIVANLNWREILLPASLDKLSVEIAVSVFTGALLGYIAVSLVELYRRFVK